MKKLLIILIPFVLVLLAIYYYAGRSGNFGNIGTIFGIRKNIDIVQENTNQAEPVDPYEGWQTFIAQDNSFSYRYPEQLTTTYITTVDWPPLIQILDQGYECTEGGSIIDRAGQTQERLVDNRKYCLTLIMEGAAGSVYDQYAYKFDGDNRVVIMTFTLQEVQCMNYDEPKLSECLGERETFDIDSVVDRMARSFEFN